MSRLEIDLPKRAEVVMEGLYKDLERRIESSPPGLCPVDMARAFLELCHAQTCGKCVPCRIGLGQLNQLIRDVLNGKATMDTLDLMEKTALSIMDSADCAIGYEAANALLDAVVVRVGLAVLLVPALGYPGILAAQALSPVLPCAVGATYLGRYARRARSGTGAGAKAAS